MIQSNTENEQFVFNQTKCFILFLFLTIGITAVFKTNAKTIFLPSLLIVFFIPLATLKKIDFKKTLHFLAAFLFFFIVYHLIYIRFQYNNIQSIGDHSFYSQVSAFINYSGIESYYFDYTNSKNNLPLPYHYGENWVTIILSNLTGLNEFKTQEFLTIPILLSTGFSYLYLLFKKWVKKNIVAICLALIITVGSASFAWAQIKIPFITDYIDQYIFPYYHMPKFAFSFFCNCIIVYSIFYNEISIKKETILITCFAVLGCVSFFPALAVFCFFYARRKKIKELKLLIFPAIIAFYYVGFYAYAGLESSNMNPVSKNIFGDCISVFQYAKTNLNIAFKTVMQLIFLHLPFIAIVFLLIGLKKIKQFIIANKVTFIVFTLVVLSGMIFWSSLWFSMGSISLFVDGSLVFFRITILVSIFYLLFNHYHELKKQFLITSALMVLCTYGVIMFLTHEQVIKPSKLTLYLNNELRSSAKPFIYLRDYDCSGTIYKKNLLAATSVGEFSSIKTLHQGVYVNINSIERSQDCLEYSREEKFITSAPYYQYKLKQSKPESEILKEFIKQNRIDYLIAEKNYFSPSVTKQDSTFLSIIKKEILYDDQLKVYLFELNR